MAGYWPCYILCLQTSTVSQFINIKKELDQYPAILTEQALSTNPIKVHSYEGEVEKNQGLNFAKLYIFYM